MLIVCWAKSALNFHSTHKKNFRGLYYIKEFTIYNNTNLQNGVVTIPRSTKEYRIVENSDVFDFELSKEDMERIDRLNQDHQVGPNPDNFNF
jgi:hypothetical protein